MNHQPDLDERLGDLLRRELPVPGHREGYREHLAALLTAEAVARENRRSRRPLLWWRAIDAAEEPGTMRRMPRRKARSRRLVIAVAIASVLIIVIAIGSVEALRRLGEPTTVVRITDDTLAPADNPVAAPTTVVITGLASLAETKEIIRDTIRAINTGDTESLRKLYAANGWVENDADDTNIQGSVGIAEYWMAMRDQLGVQIELDGDPIPYDRYVIQRVRYVLPDASEPRAGIHAYQIDTNGQIAHEWIIGWVNE